MALSMSLKLDNGVELSQAYAKISQLVFNYKDSSSLVLELCVFKDSTAYSDGLPEVIKFLYKCTGTTFDMYFSEPALSPDMATNLSNAYTWLKSMPQYTSAEDV